MATTPRIRISLVRVAVRLLSVAAVVLLIACEPIALRDGSRRPTGGAAADDTAAMSRDGEPPPLGAVPPGRNAPDVSGPVSPESEPTTEPETAAPPPLDVERVNDPALRELVGPEASREAVLRAQVMLDRRHFSVGEIDAKYGRNTQGALRAFQASRGLKRTGEADDATWAALDDGGKAIVPHLVTAADASGSFRPLPRGMMARSKLSRLGYESGAEAVGERFHVSPHLLAEINEGKSFERPGEVVLVTHVHSARPAAAASLVVDASDGAVIALDGGGRVLAWYPATTGSKHDPLPIGNWAVTYIARTPKFHYYPKLFWDAPAGDRPAVLQPGPNNPVGLVWIDLTKEHYGIHGTPEPSNIGHTASHGCIRLTNWDASELARMIAPETPVVMRK